MGTNGDNSKLIKVSFRIHPSLVEECEKEALDLKIPLSHVLRDRFLNQSTSQNYSKLEIDTQIFGSIKSLEEKLDFYQVNQSNSSEVLPTFYPLLLEILFLLREFLFERNAQVLKTVNEKLDSLLGKERKKVR